MTEGIHPSTGHHWPDTHPLTAATFDTKAERCTCESSPYVVASVGTDEHHDRRVAPGTVAIKQTGLARTRPSWEMEEVMSRVNLIGTMLLVVAAVVLLAACSGQGQARPLPAPTTIAGASAWCGNGHAGGRRPPDPPGKRRGGGGSRAVSI